MNRIRGPRQRRVSECFRAFPFPSREEPSSVVDIWTRSVQIAKTRARSATAVRPVRSDQAAITAWSTNWELEHVSLKVVELGQLFRLHSVSISGRLYETNQLSDGFLMVCEAVTWYSRGGCVQPIGSSKTSKGRCPLDPYRQVQRCPPSRRGLIEPCFREMGSDSLQAREPMLRSERIEA